MNARKLIGKRTLVLASVRGSTSGDVEFDGPVLSWAGGFSNRMGRSLADESLDKSPGRGWLECPARAGKMKRKPVLMMTMVEREIGRALRKACEANVWTAPRMIDVNPVLRSLKHDEVNSKNWPPLNHVGIAVRILGSLPRRTAHSYGATDYQPRVHMPGSGREGLFS